MLQVSEFGLQVGNGVYEVQIGETWRVTCTFKYVTSEDTTVTLRACPYHYRLGILDRIGSCCGTTDIDLAQSSTPVLKEESVDIYFKPASEGGIANGTYGLIVEILGTDAEVHIDNCIIVGGNPSGILDAIPALIGVMMMMMIIPMMGEIE